ncbi:FHA domain-containing protein [Arsenicicoccus piscis]|uniref:FHA domain-containing protein n=1 Tax=Arsenicicoccus piscis TaxID=673954 RepID=UPI0024E0F9A4|nr:FHA domain-containing protein [Arsenicicoccus piscis]
MLIGRNPECTLILEDDFASGRHARIVYDDGQWTIEDLGSTNGTYLDDFRLTAPAPLEPDSRLRIGRTVLEPRK